MELTREKAIEEHRKMWNWIADETLRTRKIVDKADYFKMATLDLDYPINDYPLALCFLCEYASNTSLSMKCKNCLLEWPGGTCICSFEGNPDALYSKFTVAANESNYKEAANIARQIANLPEKEVLSNAESCNE